MRRVGLIHLIGIGGTGMGGIAEVLVNLGYRVQGSDRRAGAVTERLRRLGITVFMGHAAAQVAGADVVVISSAIPADNPELVAAREARIPIVRRAEMLAELMRFRQGIAVAGTHGKTTTTSLVASVLAEGGLDPTFVIGGQLNSAGSNARLGAGRYLVAEADESDASFLHLQPVIAIVTNIDNDHLVMYGGDFARLRQSFVEFLHNLPFWGLAVLCIDDPVVHGLLPEVSRPVTAYGLGAEADLRAVAVEPQGGQTRFDVLRPGRPPLPVTLNLPGLHNVRNALAAIAVATELEVADAAIQQALQSFQGIGRRLEQLGDVRTPAGLVTLVDDYGHHPTEIEATLAAARQAWPGRRVVLVFQPHRYSRTHDVLEDFGRVLAGADALVVTEVYAAGEVPIPNADGRAICRAVRGRGRIEPVFVEDPGEIAATLAGLVRDGDVVLTMGAGSIGAVAQELPARLAAGAPA
jgi:UDP-N-acetylmuramate--alanine ligase